MSTRYNKTKEGVSCDPKTASTLAASSIAQYFIEKGWKIISFFPNASCLKEKSEK